MDEEGKSVHQDRIKTFYSNIVRISHSPYEFMIDFGQFQPEGNKAFMDIRIITSPQHAKAILRALKENIERYEERYGKINVVAEGEDEEDIGPDWQFRRK